MYNNNTLTISVPEGYKLESINFSCSEKGIFNYTINGSKASNPWTATTELRSITYTAGGTVYIQSIEVKYSTVGGTTEPEPSKTSVALSFEKESDKVGMGEAYTMPALKVEGAEYNDVKDYINYTISPSDSPIASVVDGVVTFNTETTGDVTITANLDENETYVLSGNAPTFTLTVYDPNANDGSEEKPYTVAELIALNNSPSKNVYVVGYIVGYMKNNAPVFGSDNAEASNLIIADSADETDGKNIVPVELKSGTTIRTDLNLSDNPKNLGRQILLCGSAEAYFSRAGLKSLTSYKWLSDVETPAVSAPVFKPDPKDGPVDLLEAISLSCETEGATIYYRTNTMDDEAVYKDDIIVDQENNYIIAWAELNGVESEHVEATYTFNKVATPKIIPSISMVKQGTEVTITCDTEDAVIYYWVVSDDVDMDDYERYEPGVTEIIINSETMIEAYAEREYWIKSETASIVYDVVGPHDLIDANCTFDFLDNKNIKSTTENTNLEPGGDTSTNNYLSGTYTNSEGVTIEFSKADYQYNYEPRWWNNGVVRMYGNASGGNTLTITAPEGHKIEKITFRNPDKSNFSFDILSDGSNEWVAPEGEIIKSVVFKATNQTRFDGIIINYERTSILPKLHKVEDGKFTYKVDHGYILVVSTTKYSDPNEKKEMRRYAAVDQSKVPDNWEYLDEQTAVYTCPKADDWNYEIYGIFGDDEASEPVYFNLEFATGVDSVFGEAEGEVEYYTLEGIKVNADNLQNGIYVAKKGQKAVKVLIQK